MPRYQIWNTEVNLCVAEYEADEPVLPNVFDPGYSGPAFVTREAEGSEVLNYAANNVEYDTFDFLRRFTSEERITIRTAAKTNAVLEDFMALLEMSQHVQSTDPDTVAGMQLLEAAGLLGPGRAQQILGN